MRVLISAPYFIPVLQQYDRYLREAGLETEVASVEERLTESQLMEFAGQVDGAICGDDRFSDQVLQAYAPRLKVLSKWGTGVDSIDLAAAEQLGVQVFNTPDAFTGPVADSVMSYVLAFARKTPWLDRDMKNGLWSKQPALSLAELTLGVIGVGRIGKAILRRAHGFDMELLGNDIVQIDSEFVEQVGLRMTDLTQLVEQSDFVTVNCDLNPTSRRLIGGDLLQHFKPTAVLINTARGPIVDEVALVAALEGGQVAGAALDVFEDEPLWSASTLRTMDNVMLGPHNANASDSAWRRVHWATFTNLLIGLGLEPPPNGPGGPA